jgi:hypothetical protein
MAETTVEMFLKHVNERAPRIGKMVPGLPPKFESLILQLMEKDKDDRPIDAAWVGRMLQDVEEDQFARKSAGLIAAQARTLKPTNQSGERMDDADKEAARALRGTKKRKKKHLPVPLLQRKSVRAVGLLSVLGLILFGAYYFGFKPPSVEKMFAQIEKAETPEAKAEAAGKFLDKYGDKGGELVDKAAATYREARVREREKQLHNRMASGRTKPDDADDPDAYQATWQAMEAERDGKLDEAERHWRRVKEVFHKEGELPYTTKSDVLAKARWGWLADKRLADLAAVKTEHPRLKAKIADARLKEQSLKLDPANPESLAIRALRLRDLPDHDRAAAVCDKIKELTEKEFDKHTWYLFASQMKLGLNRPGADPVGQRLKRLNDLLDATEKQAQAVKGDVNLGAERREVRNSCRDVTELYDDDPEKQVQVLVERAAKIAALVPRE